MKGIILGSVSEDILAKSKLKEEKNEYGKVLYSIDHDRPELIYIIRHGVDHSKAPKEVEYLANIKFLKDHNVNQVIGIYSVGSINREIIPGEVAIINDFIDFSPPLTFFKDRPKHIDLSNPFSEVLKDKFLNGEKIKEVVYATTEGPRLETKAEVNALRILGADVVGMTLGKEIPLLIEAEISVLALAISINFASGVNPGKISFLSDEELEIICNKLIKRCKKTLLTC